MPTIEKILVDFVKAMNPQTLYDVQECSIKSIQKLLEKNNPILAPLKDYAYSTGLSTEILLQPAGILLRDKVLKEIDL